MTKTRSFYAPGKVVIMGEYAVLDGSPAIVAAVNRGVRCVVSFRDTGCTIQAPNTTFVGPALADWTQRPGAFSFDNFNPTNTDQKVGLGGSAAATVVALLAGSAWNHRPLTDERLFEAAHAIHKRVQGSGSGVDIAASVFGGVNKFNAGVVTPLSPFQFHLIWTGHAAATGPRVQQYLAWTPRDSFVDRSAALVDNFSKDPVEAVGCANQLLCKMAHTAGIDYETPELANISTLAQKHGGASKASGAGGGDCAIALFPSHVDPTGFLAECTYNGYPPISVSAFGRAYEEPTCPT